MLEIYCYLMAAMGSLTVQNITGAPGTTLAPLLGNVTGDAGITPLERY